MDFFNRTVNLKFSFTALFCAFQLIIFSQSPALKKGGIQSVSNATADIATSYTISACGLNYVQASIQLNQRTFSVAPLPGQPQPATFSISGIPSCAPIVKAFLYVGTMGNGSAINASLSNPASTSSVFPMTIVGQDVTACWGTAGTYNYRADVTQLISGDGNYAISGIPTNAAPGMGASDANGATLFIIYRDPTQNYTGNIVIADGTNVQANGSGGGGNSSISGFSVCGTPTLTSHFMILSDLEQVNNTNVWLNIPFNSTPNYTKTANTDQVWDFISAPGAAAAAGQTSANYGFNSGADCAGLMMAGMYYRSSCLTCLVGSLNPVTLTVTTASDPNCPATVSASATGGSGNYSYAWTGTAQTGSVVTGLSPGNYTVTAKDNDNTCAGGTVTLQVASRILTLTAAPDPACPTTISVNIAGGSGGGYTYSWTPSAQTTSVATGLNAGNHTVSVMNACALGSLVVVAARATVTITATPDPNCGRTVSVTASGGTGPYTYTWTGPTQTGSVIALLSAGPHTVTTLNGCSTGSVVVNVVPAAMTVTAVADATCGASASVTTAGGSGTTTYTWTGTGSNLNSSLATALSAGVHTVTALNDCAMGSTTLLITPDPMTITATPNPTCGGTASVVASGGSGANTYSWSPAGNNLTSAVASALTAGVHTITVKNACAAGSETIQITPNQMTITATPNSTCGATASVAVVGGSGTNTYTWTGLGNNLNSITATALSEGVHTVSVKNNCAAGSATIQINPDSMTLTATPNATCGTTATVAVAGGAGNTTYSWSPTGSALTSSVATALSAGVHTITAKNNCAAGTTTILITPTNMTLTATANATCPTVATVVATGGSGTTTYSWSGTGSGLTSTVATQLSPGVHTITARNTCAAGTETILITPITINLNVASNSTVCPMNTTVTTSGTPGPYTYTWTNPTGSMTTSSSTGTTTANLGSFVYTITARDNARCGIGSATFSVSTLASSISISSPTTICMGDSIVLRAGTAASYTWGPSIYLNTANAGTITVNSQPLSSVVYTVNYRLANGCYNTQTTQVTVVPSLTLATGNTAICEGQALVLNPAFTGTNYSWQGPNNFTSASQAVIVGNASPTLTGVYTTTISTAGSCSVYSTYNVTVFASPTPTISSNSPVCAGSSLSLTSASVGTAIYSWSGPSNFGSFSQNPVITSASVLLSGPYFLSVTYTNNCIKLAGLTVTVHPLPQPFIVSNSPVCETSTLALSISGGSTYQWTGPNGFSSALSSNSIANVSPAASGVYTVISSLGSCTAASTTTVLVNPQPTINPAANNPVCEGGSLQLNSGAGSGSFQWSGPNGFTSTQQNPVISSVQLSNTGSYSLTASGVTGNCPATTSVVIVSVSPTPSVSAAGATVCLGSALTLTATGASIYTWTSPSGIPTIGSLLLIQNVSSPGIYTLTGFALSPCTGTAAVNVAVKPLPPVSALSSTVCEGQVASLNASGANAYSWSGPSGFGSALSTIVFQPATAQQSGTYTVTGTGLNSCTNTAIATLSVIPLPQLLITVHPGNICTGQSVTLTASGAQTYTWLPIGLSNTNPVRVVSPAFTTAYTVLGTNMGLCNATGAATVQVSNCSDVGLEENSGWEKSLLVFPNPSSSDITIRSEKDLDLVLVNELGQTVDRIRLDAGNDRQYPVRGLAYGVYYLAVPGQSFSRKIIIAPN